ncbi:MAG TPA: tetratricopeptide repeat protein [Bryobacteraceae bacterium]|nr:tetratricopeptide repeat protein [Bryobacteraceae bacterium]
MAIAAGAARAEGTCDLLRSSELERSGHAALEKKELGAAAGDLERAFDACPKLHGLLLEISQVQAQRREFDSAIEAARRYLDLEPGSIPGKLALANSYFMAQRLPDALAQAEAVLKSDPAQATALKLKANIEYLSGRLDPAMNALLQVLERNPGDQDAAYMLGRIYYQEGQIDHAMGQFQRVLRLDPKSYKAYDNLGLCYQANGDTQMAIRHFLTAIKLVETDHPEYDWAYANLASLLIDQGDDQKAFAAASKAADRNPNSARNFYLGGKALWKLGKLDLSANWLERSISLDPRYPDPLYLLSRVYSQMGQEEKSRAMLEKFRVVKQNAPRQRK